MKIGSLSSTKDKNSGQGVLNGEKTDLKEYIVILARSEADKSGITKEGTGKPGSELSGVFQDLVRVLKGLNYLSQNEQVNIHFSS